MNSGTPFTSPALVVQRRIACASGLDPVELIVDSTCTVGRGPECSPVWRVGLAATYWRAVEFGYFEGCGGRVGG